MTHILTSSPGSWLECSSTHDEFFTWSSSTHDEASLRDLDLMLINTWWHLSSRALICINTWCTLHLTSINTWWVFTWLDDQHMIISSSWTWLTSTHDASFTSSSSLQHHQHMMIFYSSGSCLEHHQHMMISFIPILDLMTINTWCHPKSSTTWNSTYSSNSRRNVSSTMWLSLITTSYH